MERKIASQEDYHDLKRVVSEDNENFKSWIITSLSLLGQEN